MDSHFLVVDVNVANTTYNTSKFECFYDIMVNLFKKGIEPNQVLTLHVVAWNNLQNHTLVQPIHHPHTISILSTWHALKVELTNVSFQQLHPNIANKTISKDVYPQSCYRWFKEDPTIFMHKLCVLSPCSKKLSVGLVHWIPLIELELH